MNEFERFSVIYLIIRNNILEKDSVNYTQYN